MRISECSELDSRNVYCTHVQLSDYKKYGKAHTYIMNNPGCHFIITNADATFPNGDAFYPGESAWLVAARV
jgi:4-nitrophenyl phosphatase